MQATEREPLSAPAPVPTRAEPPQADDLPSPVASAAQRGIARAATLTSIGNFSSRIFGLVFVTVKSFYFGTSQAASAFELAANVPTQFYDLLIGGMLSSALVPTLSALADGENKRADLRAFGQLLGALLGLATVLLSLLVITLVIFAVPIGIFISGGQNQDPTVIASLLQLTIPAILFLNLSGIVASALFARRKFGYTAFTATLFNIVAIVCVVLFQAQLGVAALALGLLTGSMAQLLVQLPGLRGVPIRLSLNWRVPGVSKVIRLFLPVVGGLAFAQIAVTISFRLASEISTAGPVTMRYAAQVIQFPLGMIVTAVSAAILPSLSSSSGSDFKATLAQGLRLVWALIVPASVGLYVLATPVIALLFQHGAFTAESTAYTASALRAAVPGLLFAAVDMPLIYAFYARRDTRTPTLIGIGSTAFYLILVGVLSLLAQNTIRSFTLNDLILTNSLKTGVDAVLMGFFWRAIGGLNGFGIVPLALSVRAPSLVMGVAVWLTMTGLLSRFSLGPFGSEFIVAVGATAVGGLVYLACAMALRIPELTALKGIVFRTLGRVTA